MAITQTTALENQDFYYQLVKPDHFWFKARVDNLEAMLEENGIDLNGKKGLEIGCGNSLLSSQIEDKYDCVIDGVDLTNASNRVQTRGKFYQIDITDGQNKLAKNRDFIILFDILEHIDDVPKFLNACLSYLKPGGHLLINVPAYKFLFSRYDQVAGHVRRYDSKMLRDHLNVSSLQEIQIRYWGFFYVPLLVIRRFLLNAKKNVSDQEIYRMGYLPPAKWINSILTQLSRLETWLLSGTTFGTAILAIYQKKSEGPE
jgi:SAM-dependent methyltransferase